MGGSLEAEVPGSAADRRVIVPATAVQQTFQPPIQALGPLFRNRLDSIFVCRVDFTLDIATRATSRVLGGYYRRRCLVRIYSHDRDTGRRPMEELFDTFLHEVAHHLEYTEPSSFQARACQRKKGQMHSPLFWRILSELKKRWEMSQRGQRVLPATPFDLVSVEIESEEVFDANPEIQADDASPGRLVTPDC